MQVREITEKDKDDFLRLCKQFYDGGATKRGFDLSSALVTFDKVISKTANLWGYVITDAVSGVDAGYALVTSYWCNEEEGNILILDELFVDPAFRHRGFGRTFIDWLDEHYKGKAVAITLEVLSSNIAAKDLYANTGFVEDGFVTLTRPLGYRKT